MQRILVERARRKSRLKRGGDRQRIELSDVATSKATPVDEIGSAAKEAGPHLVELIRALKADDRHPGLTVTEFYRDEEDGSEDDLDTVMRNCAIQALERIDPEVSYKED